MVKTVPVSIEKTCQYRLSILIQDNFPFESVFYPVLQVNPHSARYPNGCQENRNPIRSPNNRSNIDKRHIGTGLDSRPQSTLFTPDIRDEPTPIVPFLLRASHACPDVAPSSPITRLGFFVVLKQALPVKFTVRTRVGIATGERRSVDTSPTAVT